MKLIGSLHYFCGNLVKLQFSQTSSAVGNHAARLDRVPYAICVPSPYTVPKYSSLDISYLPQKKKNR